MTFANRHVLGEHDQNGDEYPAPPRTFRISLATQDVVIPAHLLQIAGTVGSVRDDGEDSARQTLRHLTTKDHPTYRRQSAYSPASIARPDAVKRATSAPSARSSRAPSPVPKRPGISRDNSEQEAKLNNEKRSSLPTRSQRRSWRLFFIPGTPERLSLDLRPETQHWKQGISQHDALDFAKNSRPLSNPFEDQLGTTTPSSSSWSTDNPFLTRENSFSSDIIRYDGTKRSESCTREPERTYVTKGGRTRRGTLEAIVDAVVPDALQKKITNTSFTALKRKSSMRETFEKAKKRGEQLQRNKSAQIAFEYGIYLFILMFVYFVLIGIPLWKGAVWWLYWVVGNKFVFAGGFGITLGIALLYAFAPLLILFEKDPPVEEVITETKIQPAVEDTALLIPCYKSAGLIAATLEAALKIFPPTNIFVVANGNSPEPLDNTEEICRPYGVNHIWSPIGSKIVAQFVGCYAAKDFTNVLLIDDDCALPENFPVVADRLKGNVKCIGYTIKSVGPNSTKGNCCQQAQDLEYKLSGLQRDFAGRVGSATFPHGAISLWDRKLLVQTFHEHPGFNVSEDWFFGHVARELGCRIKMCSSVFVETETPTAVFFSSGGSRGGFGEMTIFKQRFKRWNFFFVNGMWFNLAYIFGSWKLGWWEIGAKIFVFQEVYETLLYLFTPFILPISFYVRPSFCGILLASTIVMYLLNVIIFNEVHLRRKKERIGWFTMYVYYLPYKMVLTGINVASCYWSLYKYAQYFAKRHPKVTEDEKAVEVVVRLEESATAAECGLGSRLTARTVSTKLNSDDDSSGPSSLLSFPSDSHEDTILYELGYESEWMNSGLSTPTRLREGIGAIDFTTSREQGENDFAPQHARSIAAMQIAHTQVVY